LATGKIIDWLNPAGNRTCAAIASAAGWYKSEKMGALRAWLARATAEQQRICRVQALSFEEILLRWSVPTTTAYRAEYHRILDGTAVFWNVKPA
jgi:peptide/nickel transport system substrate-binding protein